jgi:hypothetical protein
MRNLLILFVAVLFSYSVSAQSGSDTCDAPDGFVCGSTVGTVYSLHWVGPILIPKGHKCCVPSIESNACNVENVGCSTVNPE